MKENILVCIFCQNSFKNKGGLGSHEPFCQKNPNRKKRQRSNLAGAKKGSTPWNKGKSSFDDHRIKPGWNKGLTGVSTGKALTPELEEERRKKISETMKKNPAAGGYRKGSGVGKGCWHESPFAGRIYLDSSFELRFAKCLDAAGISWERNKEKFLYVHEGKTRYYIPDFKINDFFIEVKGYVTNKDNSKWRDFPYKLVIIKEKDIVDMECGGLPKWS